MQRATAQLLIRKDVGIQYSGFYSGWNLGLNNLIKKSSWTAYRHNHSQDLVHAKGENSGGQLLNIYRQMFQGCLVTRDLTETPDCRVRTTTPCTVARQGFRAAPYSCWSALAVKLIINLCPALEGLGDWQSCAEACRVEAEEKQNRQNHADCQGAAAVPDGV